MFIQLSAKQCGTLIFNKFYINRFRKRNSYLVLVIIIDIDK